MLKPIFFLFLCLLLLAMDSPVSPETAPIAVKPHMVYNLSAHDNPLPLFDEQSLGSAAFNPQRASAPLSFWSPGFEKSTLYLPICLIIDFEGMFQLHSLALFDNTGQGLVEVDYGEPGAWTPWIEDSLDQYGTWKEHLVLKSIRTRFVRINFYSPGAEVGEILFFGKKTEHIVSPQSHTKREPPSRTFDAFCGINGFVNDPIHKLSGVAGILREYHRWSWDERNENKDYIGYPNNRYAFAPSWARGEHWSWNFDAFYAQAQANGLQVAPSLGGCAPHLRDHDPKRSDDKPVLPGTDPTLPASYAALADYAFQFAARFGHNPISTQHLKLSSEQTARTGLGLIDYLEDGNEPDRWWQGRGAYHRPVEYASRLSAFYDGHGGLLGEYAGVKQADPKLPVVMGGLARPDTHYLRAMLMWSRFHREDGRFPADVINLHHYCNTGGDQWAGDTTRARSPEADQLYKRLRELAAWRDRNLPDRELWLSEYGYDTNPVSPQHAPDPAMQARWLLRSTLLAQAAGIDRAFVYMLRDVSAESTTRYNSSGLTRELWHGHEPKMSWFCFAALRNGLKGYVYAKKRIHPDLNIFILEYVHPGRQDTALVIWNAGEKARLLDLKSFGIDLPNWKLSLIDGNRNGKLKDVESGLIRIDGMPQVFGFGDKPAMRVSRQYKTARPELHDEQDTCDPANEIFNKPTTSWTVPWGSAGEETLLCLAKKTAISDIWIFDTEGADSLIVEISDDENGPFRQIGSMKLDRYQEWRRLDGSDWQGACIKLKLKGGAIGEVLVYGDEL
jgi:hypothetical protein